MKAYLVTTGSIFGLIVLAHILRIMEEGQHLARDPWYILFTAAAGAMSVWAWRLVLRLSKP